MLLKHIFKTTNIIHTARLVISEQYCFDCISIKDIKNLISTLNDNNMSSISEITDEIKLFLSDAILSIDNDEHINKLTTIKTILKTADIIKQCDKLIQLLQDNNLQQFMYNIVSDKTVNIFIQKYIKFLTNATDWLDTLQSSNTWLVDLNNSIFQMLIDNIAKHIASLPRNKKNIHEAFTDYLNNTELIQDEIINTLLQYFNESHFDINFINSVYVPPRGPFYITLQLSQSEIIKLIKSLLAYIQKENMLHIDENDLENKINSFYAADLDNLNLAVDESITLDALLLHQLMHTDNYIPIIYINGNVVVGDKIVSDAGRLHHYDIYLQYLNDMTLHKNDIIKKTEEEWTEEPRTVEQMIKWNTMRAVKSEKDVLILTGYSNEAKQQLQRQLGQIKIYNINDSQTLLTRLAYKKKCFTRIA